MKIDPLNILLNPEFLPDKKVYYISGNEATLMDCVSETIIQKYKKMEAISLSKIDTIENFVGSGGLFENKKVFLGKNCKGINEINLMKVKKEDALFVFVQQNSPKIKSTKNIIIKSDDYYLVDCYELDKGSKIRVINNFLESNNINIKKDLYWVLLEKLDNRYVFLKNSLRKMLGLEAEEINFDSIRKIINIDSEGKEKLFFQILKKNKEIIEIYRRKILSNSDVSELYYYCKYFSQMIIDNENEIEFTKKIPAYLFREKNFLIDLFRKHNLKKKKALLNLLSKTEATLRKEGSLSLIVGLRFLLNIKKIAIS